MRYVPGIDGIRAVAVLLVLAFHTTAGHPLPGGFVGVDVFFVLSGYLITTQLLGPIDLRVFLARRLARLWPAMLATLAFVAVVTVLEGRVPTACAYAATYAVNIFFAHRIPVGGGAVLVSHTWSLAIEVQFYVAWALAVLHLRRRGASTRALLLVAVAVAVVSLGLRVAYVVVLHDSGLAYFSTESRLDALFLGAALAIVGSIDRDRLRVIARPVPAALLLLSTVAAFRFRTASGLLVGMPLAAIAAGLLLCATVTRPDLRLVRWLASRPLVGLGLRSYSLYLWHFPVFVLLQDHTSATGVVLVLVEWSLALLLAESSYRLVEVPARRAFYARIGRGRLARRGAASLGSASASTRNTLGKGGGNG